LPTALGLLHLGSLGSAVLIISEALLSLALIIVAQRWPPTKNSNEQCRWDAALTNKLTGAPGWHPLQINIPSRRLGCAFHFLFRFWPGLIFWNPQVSADCFGFRRTHVGIKLFQGKINFFPESSGTRNQAKIRRERPLKYCTLCHV
jgi:hypothetical protein